MLEPIKISEFKNGHWIKQIGYKAFIPAKINRQWLIDKPEIEGLIAQAHQKLGGKFYDFSATRQLIAFI